MKDELKGKTVTSYPGVARHCALLFGLIIGLSACSSAPRNESTQTTPAQSQTAAALASNAITTGTSNTIPELPAANSAQQQRLISEINRDGAPLDFESLREQVPEAVNPQGDDVVELNYEQADLRLVLEELADAVDITIVIDPAIDDRVSVRTSPNRPLSRDDIWPLIRMLTRNAGITLERIGDFYAAYQIVGTLPVEIVTPDTLNLTSGNRVMQVTPLIYVSVDTAIEVLGPIVEEGAITKLTTRNVVAISGTTSQLDRINQMLTLIDADPFSNQGIQLYQLNNASAEEVALELTEILILIEGPTPSYQVKGIERINAIMVTAPATRGFEEVARWIQILDADNQEQVEQLFHYQVRNLNALELADTLTNVFEDDEDENIPGLLNPQDPNLLLPDAATSNLEGSVAPTSQVSTIAVSANLTVRIVADEATNSLLIRSTARDYRQLLTTINQLDAVPLQVMVNAVIAQVTLNEQTKFGVDWSRIANEAGGGTTSTTASTNFLPGAANSLLFTKSFVDGSALVDATLEAIAADNEVQLLARPSLTVVNNQEGEIKIGANVPVDAGQTIGVGGQTTNNIQYRDTGITLTLTPQINADGVVNLTISQVLNSVDNSAPTLNNNPTFNNQEITTSVVVRDSENVVLGGLIQTENEQLNTGVPGLNKIPLFGNLFSYQQDTQERKELFIVLRPEIVDLNAQRGPQYTDILQRFELAAEVMEDAGL